MGCLWEAVARATRVDLINLMMNYSTRQADALASIQILVEMASPRLLCRICGRLRRRDSNTPSVITGSPLVGTSVLAGGQDSKIRVLCHGARGRLRAGRRCSGRASLETLPQRGRAATAQFPPALKPSVMTDKVSARRI